MPHHTETVLITGATRGIGYALAEVCAKHHHPLVLVARDAERLLQVKKDFEQTYSVPVHTIVADLQRPDAAQTIAADITKHHLTIDILVNNAGFGGYGLFADTNMDVEREMIAVNITAITALTKQFLPGMQARGNGKILQVASTAAFQPGPYMAVYFATKAYVLSFSEALHEELRGTGVSVTALCPGPTPTDFQKRASLEKVALFEKNELPTKKVAEIGYRAMMRGKRVIIPGTRNNILAFATRLAPRHWAASIVKRQLTSK